MKSIAENRRRYPEPAAELDRDGIFDILSNFRRRKAIEFLLESDEPIALPDLVDRLTEVEGDRHDGAPTDKLRASVYSSMVQSHLPKMVDYGVIHFDDADQTVRLAPAGKRLQAYLDPNRSTSHRWSILLLLATIIVTFLAIGHRMGLPFIRTVPFEILLYVFVGAVIAITIVQYVFRDR